MFENKGRGHLQRLSNVTVGMAGEGGGGGAYKRALDLGKAGVIYTHPVMKREKVETKKCSVQHFFP